MDVSLAFKNEDYNKHFEIIMCGDKVGTISFRQRNGSVSIESISIDMFKRRQYIGSTVIRYLLKEYGDIHGFSSPGAIGFWEKLGAEFDYDVNESMVYELLEMGEYPPFRIVSDKFN